MFFLVTYSLYFIIKEINDYLVYFFYESEFLEFLIIKTKINFMYLIVSIFRRCYLLLNSSEKFASVKQLAGL